MAKLNPNYDKLAAGYLFPEIAKRTRAFLERHPGRRLHKLGVGNTTEPLPPTLLKGLATGVEKLGSRETYTGYGDELGNRRLRDAIADLYAERGVRLALDEIIVSDGAKPDAGNIQSIFSLDNVVAVQDPAYPVYVDTNVIAGRSGPFDRETNCYEGIVYMPCTEENGFFSPPPSVRVDLIYLCSPNNPTGAVATHDQLQSFVDYAKRNRAVILFDAAYAAFIRDPALPHSIYEIPGAETCAIEINSFSKVAGFTGVRLGWSVVPQVLEVEDAAPGKVNALWQRRQCTFFNGASNIAQEGGIAALSPEGRRECQALVDYYMENARIIREGVNRIGLTVYGGVNAPYLWLKTPQGMRSWAFFDKLLEEAGVVCTPGSGFGPSGEGFVRLSAFGHREDILEAVRSLEENLRL